MARTGAGPVACSLRLAFVPELDGVHSAVFVLEVSVRAKISGNRKIL